MVGGVLGCGTYGEDDRLVLNEVLECEEYLSILVCMAFSQLRMHIYISHETSIPALTTTHPHPQEFSTRQSFATSSIFNGEPSGQNRNHTDRPSRFRSQLQEPQRHHPLGSQICSKVELV